MLSDKDANRFRDEVAKNPPAAVGGLALAAIQQQQPAQGQATASGSAAAKDAPPAIMAAAIQASQSGLSQSVSAIESAMIGNTAAASHAVNALASHGHSNTNGQAHASANPNPMMSQMLMANGGGLGMPSMQAMGAHAVGQSMAMNPSDYQAMLANHIANHGISQAMLQNQAQGLSGLSHAQGLSQMMAANRAILVNQNASLQNLANDMSGVGGVGIGGAGSGSQLGSGIGQLGGGGGGGGVGLGGGQLRAGLGTLSGGIGSQLGGGIGQLSGGVGGGQFNVGSITSSVGSITGSVMNSQQQRTNFNQQQQQQQQTATTTGLTGMAGASMPGTGMAGAAMPGTSMTGAAMPGSSMAAVAPRQLQAGAADVNTGASMRQDTNMSANTANNMSGIQEV